MDERTCPCCGRGIDEDGYKRVIRELRRIAEGSTDRHAIGGPDDEPSDEGPPFHGTVTGRMPASAPNAANRPRSGEVIVLAHGPDDGIEDDDSSDGVEGVDPGFRWSEPDEDGYICLRYRGRECQGSQVYPDDGAGIARVMREHGPGVPYPGGG